MVKITWSKRALMDLEDRVSILTVRHSSRDLKKRGFLPID
jgi:plasmid stabilization system protein ParE